MVCSHTLPKQVTKVFSQYSKNEFIAVVVYTNYADDTIQAIHTILKPELLIPSQVITPAIYICSKRCTIYYQEKKEGDTSKSKLKQQIKKIKVTAAALSISVATKSV